MSAGALSRANFSRNSSDCGTTRWRSAQRTRAPISPMARSPITRRTPTATASSTRPAAAKFLWRKTSNDTGWAELGQTWSSAAVTRLAADIGNASNPENVVLIFGAGYDPNVDDVNPCLLQRVDANSVTLKPIGSGTVDYSTPLG